MPLRIQPFDIDDEPPCEEEVIKILFKMKNNKTPGASGITVENLKFWYKKARQPSEGNDPDLAYVRLWEKVLELINIEIAEGEIPREFCNGTLVLIPKSSPGEYRGIALLEVIYKLVSAIINSRLQDRITYDDAVNGFRKRRGTGTAIMEAKLLMQLHYSKNEPLYMIFLDLNKTYDALDREQAARIFTLTGRILWKIIQSVEGSSTGRHYVSSDI